MCGWPRMFTCAQQRQGQLGTLKAAALIAGPNALPSRSLLPLQATALLLHKMSALDPRLSKTVIV